MIDPAVLDAMVMSGCTAEQIAAAVKASMRAEDEAKANRRERDRIRKRKERARENVEKSTVASTVSNGQTRTDAESTDAPPSFPDKEKCPKEINPSTHPCVVSSPAREGCFAEFWSVYPHKVGKRDASKAFDRAAHRAPFEAIMAGLRRYVAKTDDRPWCNPSTWLNQDRWEDMPAESPAPQARGSPRRETDLQRISREMRERRNDERRTDFEFDGPTIQGFPG